MGIFLKKKKRILSGMRPTGDLHIGHWLGVLQNWVSYQKTHECFFMIADWHALMSEYKETSLIKQAIQSNLADWLAVGIDPQQAVVFLQSDVPEHLELSFILSSLTPVSWLERCPTYKEQLQEIKDKDISTHAFLGYPVLQSADIALYKADEVPVGKDQLPHLELAREVIRRFHYIFACDVFPEPKPILSQNGHKVLGVDRRKMSKSYHNDIAIGSSPKHLLTRVKKMITDKLRIRLSDPGHPDQCNVFAYYKIFSPEKVDGVREWCERAKKGCMDCKINLTEVMEEQLEPIRNRRNDWLKRPDDLQDILKEGALKARLQAQETMIEVRRILSWRQ